MRPLGAELLRARSRRAVMLLMLSGLVLTVVLVAVSAWLTRPYTAEETANAQPVNEKVVQRCEKNPGRFGVDDAGQCESRIETRGYERDREPLDAGFVESLGEPLTGALMLLALLIGATFVGAEFTSGSIGNLLLFEPRRFRVWLAKVVAIGALSAFWAALCWAIYVTPLALLGRSWDTGTWGPDWLTNMAYFGGRGAALVVGATIAGVVLTLALRSTIATVGLAFGYLICIEAIGNALLASRIADFTISNRVLGVLHGSYVRRIWDSDATPERFEFTLLPSAIYLVALGLVLCVASVIVFRRRDVEQ